METINFKVDVEKAGIRIDRYLADVCLDFSRNFSKTRWFLQMAK